jgi:hypothetical protein
MDAGWRPVQQKKEKKKRKRKTIGSERKKATR